MPLTKGGRPSPGSALDELTEVPEVPETIPRGRGDRPLIFAPDGSGKQLSYTRASTLGKAIEDDYRLNLYHQRCVLFGASRRPDLVALAASVATNEGDDRKTLDELVEKCKEAAGGDKGANVGTALHKLSERRDAGEDLSYLPEVLLAAIDAYMGQMAIFEVLATETFVVCDELGAAGTFDRVVRLLVDLEFTQEWIDDTGKKRSRKVVIPAGTVLVVDLKTSAAKSAQYWGAPFGAQQAVYGLGVPYTHTRGRIGWEALLGAGNAPSREWALLLHVPSDSPADAGLVVVDLERGLYAGKLANEVREARKDKALLSECWPVKASEPVNEPPSEAAAQVLLDLIRQSTDEEQVGTLYEQNEQHWTDEHTAAAKDRIEQLRTRALAEPGPAVELGDHPADVEPETFPGQVTAEELDEVEAEKIQKKAEPPVPDRVSIALLSGRIKNAPSRDALDALYEQNEAIWQPAHTIMVKARIAEIEAGAPVEAVQ